MSRDRKLSVCDFLLELIKVDLLSLNATTPEEGATTPEAERIINLQQKCAYYLTQHMSADALVPLTLKYALTELDHIMVPTQQRMISSFFSMMNYAVRQLISYDNAHPDFPMPVISNYFLT